MRTDTMPIAPDAASRADLIGRTLGDRYRLLRALGSGAMGDVYLAEHVVLGKKLAVKVLKQSLSRNDELVKRFEQEAVAASRIGHENIVDVSDFGRTDDGSLYFVMEALEGESLGDLVARRGALPLGEGLPLLLQVCKALTAAHARGIVHRDLKLDNLMLVRRDDGSALVKVLDFGISKVSAQEDGAQRNVTQAGTVLGTPNYMSPEQVRGEPVDHRADIYAFGILAYEIATGGVPFQAPSLTAVLMQHLGEAPQPPSARRPDLGLPQAFDALVLRALEKDREQRFQSMNEVKDALVRCLEAIGVFPLLTPPTPMAAVTLVPSVTPAGKVNAAATLQPSATLPMDAPLPLVHRAPDPSLAATDPMADTYRPATDPELRAAVARAKAMKRGPSRAKLALAIGVPVLAVCAAGAFLLLRKGPEPVAVPPPPPVVTPPVVTPPTTDVTPPTTDVAPPTTDVTPPTTDVTPPTTDVTPKPVARPLPQRLAGKDIARVFGAGQKRLRGCLQPKRDKLPATSGRLELSLTIADSGAVSAASVKTPLDASITACLVARMKELRFPRHREATQTFDIPLDYAFKD